jgi:hypothetical protein
MAPPGPLARRAACAPGRRRPAGHRAQAPTPDPTDTCAGPLIQRSRPPGVQLDNRTKTHTILRTSIPWREERAGSSGKPGPDCMPPFSFAQAVKEKTPLLPRLELTVFPSSPNGRRPSRRSPPRPPGGSSAPGAGTALRPGEGSPKAGLPDHPRGGRRGGPHPAPGPDPPGQALRGSGARHPPTAPRGRRRGVRAGRSTPAGHRSPARHEWPTAGGAAGPPPGGRFWTGQGGH